MHLPGKLRVIQVCNLVNCTNVFFSICSGALGVLGANIYSERPQFYIYRTVSIFSGADFDNWILDFDYYYYFFFKSVTAPSPTPINSSQTDGFEAFFGI